MTKQLPVPSADKSAWLTLALAVTFFQSLEYLNIRDYSYSQVIQISILIVWHILGLQVSICLATGIIRPLIVIKVVEYFRIDRKYLRMYIIRSFQFFGWRLHPPFPVGGRPYITQALFKTFSCQLHFRNSTSVFVKFNMKCTKTWESVRETVVS